MESSGNDFCVEFLLKKIYIPEILRYLMPWESKVLHDSSPKIFKNPLVSVCLERRALSFTMVAFLRLSYKISVAFSRYGYNLYSNLGDIERCRAKARTTLKEI